MELDRIIEQAIADFNKRQLRLLRIRVALIAITATAATLALTLNIYALSSFCN